MDKSKHKDGLLAAGKKRLEQFRQKKSKGSSSKAPKVGNDNVEIDLEAGIGKNPVGGKTDSNNSRSAKDSVAKDLISVKENQFETGQRSEVYPTHPSDLSIQHTSSEVSDSVSPVQITRTDASAIYEVGYLHSVGREDFNSSSTGNSSESVSTLPLSGDIPQDSRVSISLDLTNVANIQEVPSLIYGNDSLGLSSRVKHAEAESIDLVDNTSAIAEMKEYVVVEARMDSRMSDVDEVNVPQNEVEDRIHVSNEEMLDNNMAGPSQSQVHGGDTLEPELSFNSRMSTADLPTTDRDNPQGTEKYNQGLLPGNSSEDRLSFNPLNSSVKIDGNDHEEVPSNQFQESLQRCKEEHTLSPPIGPGVRITRESLNVEGDNFSPAEGTAAIHDEEHSPESGSNSGECSEITTAVHDEEHSAESGSDLAAIGLPVDPVGALNSQPNDNHDVIEVGITGESLNVEANNNCSPVELTASVYDERSSELGPDSIIGAPVNPVGDLNSEPNDNHDLIPSSEYTENVLQVQSDEGRLELQVGSQLELNDEGSLYVSEVPAPIVYPNLHQTEIRSVQLETDLEVSEGCEKAIIETCETSECLTLGKQTDSVIEHDELNNLSRTGVLDTSTVLEKEINQIHSEENVQIIGSDVSTNVAGSLGLITDNLNMDGSAEKLIENVDSILESTAGDSSGSIESCKDAQLNVRVGECIISEAMMPNSDVYVTKTCERIEPTNISEEMIETSLSSELVKNDIVATKSTDIADTLNAPDVLDLSVNNTKEAQSHSEQMVVSVESVVVEAVQRLHSNNETEEKGVSFVEQETASITREEFQSSDTVPAEIELNTRFHALEDVEPLKDLGVMSVSGTELSATGDILNANTSKLSPDEGERLLKMESGFSVANPHTADPINNTKEAQSQSEQMVTSVESVVVKAVQSLHSNNETEEKGISFVEQETASITREEFQSNDTVPAEIELNTRFHALEDVEPLKNLGAMSVSGTELSATGDILNANTSKLSPDEGEQLSKMESGLSVANPPTIDPIEGNTDLQLSDKKNAIEERIDEQISSAESSEIRVSHLLPQIPSSDSASQIFCEGERSMYANVSSFSIEDGSSQRYGSTKHDSNLSLVDTEDSIKIGISPCAREYNADVNLTNLTDAHVSEQKASSSEGPCSGHTDLHERSLEPELQESESSLLDSNKNSLSLCAQEEKKTREAEKEGLQVKLNDGAAKITDETESISKVLTHVVGRLHYLVHTWVRPLEQTSKVSQEALLSSVCLDILEQDSDNWINTLQESLEERKQTESTIRQLQDELSRRETHIARATADFIELSQNYADLQKDLDEKEMKEKKVRQEFAELSQNYEDLQKNLKETMKMEKEAREELSTLSQNYEDLQKNLKETMKMEKEAREELSTLSQNYECLQKDEAEKMQMKIQLSQWEYLLSERDADIEKLSNQVSELSQNYNLVTAEAAKSAKKKDILEDELEHLKRLYTDQEQTHLKMCLQARNLSDRVASVVNTVDESEHVKDNSISFLEVAIDSLLEKYEANCVEVKLLSQRVLDMDAAHRVEMDSLEALTISQKEELTLMHSQLEVLTNELTHARMEASQEIEIKEGHLKQLTELSQSCEELQKKLEERLHLENKIGAVEDLLLIKEGDIQKLSELVDNLNAETTKISEEKTALEVDLKNIQMLYAEHEELYSRMCIQCTALSQRIFSTLGKVSQVENIDDNAMAYLEYAVGLLLEQHAIYLAEIKSLSEKVNDSYVPANEEGNNLKALVDSKEREIFGLNDEINLLRSEFSRIKEESEQRVQQAEEKLLGVREKLSMAVTKGKALLQQRDNLKQLLAEKTTELDGLESSYKRELQAKDSALSEAYSKVKHYAESVDRVEALESELAYIRNSANALRESFLQKDAILQKIEELLEDSNIPEEIQFKDIFEKVDFLIEAYNQRSLNIEGVQSQVRELDDSPSADPVSQTQEIEELTRRCDDLLRKYRGMAEQSAMLEQSLVERNIVIQKWEEVLDSIEMPQTVRSKEPEDRIKWLGKEVSDSYTHTALLQQEVENLKLMIESLNNSVEQLQEQNDIVSAELKAKKEELEVTSLDLAAQHNNTSRSPCQANTEIGFSKRSILDEIEQERDEQSQSPMQKTDLEALVASFPTMLGDVVQAEELKIVLSAPSLNIAIGQLVNLLGENCRDLTLKIKDAKAEVEKLLASSAFGKEMELELSQLREELSIKSINESNLYQQLEEFHIIKSELENEVNQSQVQIKEMAEKISSMTNEISKFSTEASQAEEKLAAVREKLSLAVKKGKGVVQQRDALKQSLEEKIAELNEVMKEREMGEVALKEAEDKVKYLVQRADILEAELLTSKECTLNMERSLIESNTMLQKFAEAVENLSVIGAPRSGDIIQKIQWVAKTVVDAERRVGLSEQEAKKSRKGVELLALEVEETQGRLDSLNEELKLAERNISILIEDKKKVEAAKAEMAFRLEHATANINSLLFELTQSKESVGKLERENSSLVAQLEELAHKQSKSLEQLKDLPHLYNKVHSLKDCQDSLLKLFASECLKLAEDMKGSDALAVRLSKQFSSLEGESTNVTFNACQDFVENSYPTIWESEALLSPEDWKQRVDTGSMKLLCESMESELQSFSDFFSKFIAAASQDSVALSQLLSGTCDKVHLISENMKNLAKDVDLSMSKESLIFEKDKKINNLEVQFKTVVGKMKASIEKLEGVQKQAWVQSSNDSTLDVFDSDLPSTEFEKLALSLAGRLDLAVKGLARYVVESGDIKKQNQELRSQLADAESIFNRMDEQRRQDNLKIAELQKSLEDFEVNTQRIYEELHSHQDILLIKRQEESKLVEALNKAETQVAELSDKVEELQKSKQDLEASLSKASSRFFTTVNNFNNFKRLAEKLIEEAQGQHLLLEGRDTQISQLRDEIASKRTEITSLRSVVDDKTTILSQIHKQIRDIILKDDQSIELPTESDLQVDVNGTRELLETLATRFQFRSEDQRIQLARKDALLQDLQMRHDDLVGKVNFLQASLQEKQRFLDERDNAIMPEQSGPSTQVDEMGNRAKLVVPPPAIVTRGRKVSASDQFVLDVDMQNDRSLGNSTDDDKGHAFKPLTASRLVPRGARFLVDRVDGFWVSAERLLMRRPEARLSVMLYWVILHIWMAVLLF